MAGKIPPQFLKNLKKKAGKDAEEMPMKEHMMPEEHAKMGKGKMPMKKGMKR